MTAMHAIQSWRTTITLFVPYSFELLHYSEPLRRGPRLAGALGKRVASLRKRVTAINERVARQLPPNGIYPALYAREAEEQVGTEDSEKKDETAHVGQIGDLETTKTAYESRSQHRLQISMTVCFQK